MDHQSIQNPKSKIQNQHTDYQQLIDAASDARKRAYAPYSHFRVGAALLTRSGKVYTGCNIENASFTPTICAERTAISTAIAGGEEPGSFEAIAIVADAAEPTAPCGVCRQVLMELARDATVIMAAAPERGEGRLVMRVEELLPHGFTSFGA